ncbi:YdcF family protein [Akkermansiaceae bacterium]|nr:YdcF family protein [Akkermansiaceae bacterium]MDC1205945.1 YdcF family protein [Akkermansiaceae bacterium]
MFHKRKWLLRLLGGLVFSIIALGSWVQWGGWPDQSQLPLPVFAKPDVILVLGGGDRGRSREALRLAADHPEIPLLVTGDGGAIVKDLLKAGLSKERIIHEKAATSTVENAKFSAPLLEEIGAEKLILVTNWYHVPRAQKIFLKFQPDREFCVSFEPRSDPPTAWDYIAERRERMAAVHNLFLHGVWSW